MGLRPKRTPKKPSAKAPLGKVLPLSRILSLVRRERARGSVIVTTNGCFDILHIGHARYLEFTKRHGDILIVGINSDKSVKRNKGDSRPIVPERERAELIASLKPVDAVFIFDETTPDSWLRAIRPHVHVKGSDRRIDQIVERETVASFGGKIILAPYVKNRSTTNVIKRVLESGR